MSQRRKINLNNMKNKVFEECKECETHECCGSAIPFVLNDDGSIWATEDEANAISKEYDITKNSFFDGSTGKFGRITKINGLCTFLSSKGCRVPLCKPYDCKMYPYNILKRDDKFYLIRHTNCCDPQITDWTKSLEVVREYMRDYLEDYAMEEKDLIPGSWVEIEIIDC